MNQKIMTTYLEAQRAGDKLGERLDCTVIATSVAARVPYDTAHKILAKHGRENGRRYNYYHNLESIFEELGYRATDTHYRDRGPGSWGRKPKRTPVTIGRYFPKGTYILFMRGHVAAMIDGTVYDWSAHTRKHITHVFEIDRGI